MSLFYFLNVFLVDTGFFRCLFDPVASVNYSFSPIRQIAIRSCYKIKVGKVGTITTPGPG